MTRCGAAQRSRKTVSALGRIAAGRLPATRWDLCHRYPLAAPGSLLETPAEHILHMQQALSQMNLQLHHVLSDITEIAQPKSARSS
jgi:hypothetical protein